MPASRIEELLRIIEPDHGAEVLVGPDDLPELQAYVQSDDPYLAERAASVAGLVNDDATTSVLMEALASPYEQVRIAATSGLARVPSMPSGAYRAGLADPSPAVRRFTLRALGRRLTDRQEDVPAEIAALVEGSASEAADPLSRLAATVLATRMAAQAVDAALVQRVLQGGLPATDLGTLLGPDGGEALVETIRSAAEPGVVAAAVDAATVVGGDAARQAFEVASRHKNTLVRRRVASGVQKEPGAVGAKDLIVTLLEDPDPSVRREAIASAIQVQAPEVKRKVDDVARGDRDEGVRSLARAASRRIRGGND